MAQEKGAETPIEKYARFRRNPQAWETEMKLAGLNAAERELLHRELDVSSGLCIAQEQFMMLVQLPEIGGFDLQWADRLRKSIAKKNPKEYDKLTKEFYDNMREKNLSENLCAYVWDTLIAMNRGYGFNAAHTLGYSLVALQEMNLAHNFPIIFWNTANLIVDSAGVAETEEDDEETLVVELEDSEEVEEIVDIYEPEEWEEYEYEDLPDRSAKKKKKTKSINFGKIATAIGKFQMAGIKVTPPNINESGFTFTPLVKENAIASGLRNITRISADLVNQIITNRPYTSIEDFQEKVKVNRTQMLMLLKCGAFDSLEPDRMAAIQKYLSTKAATKEKLTLANVPMLMKYGILDEDAAEYCELYSFNKFLKKHADGDVIVFPNEKAMEYYCDHFDVDLLLDGYSIGVKTWEKIYKKGIAPLSEFIKDNMEDLLDRLNTALIEEQFESYAKGTISHYEIESMSFYYHEHELKHVNRMIYDIKDFNKLPEKPIVARKIPTKDGKEIELLELAHICGTVLDKNKMKNSISLLTPTGVVTVKIWKNQFAKYDKQISEIQSDGKKKVREKSWFSRGNLLYLQGVRRGDAFIPKAYKGSTHRVPIMKITSVEGDKIIFTDKRYDEE
jgi:DNA polymerase-3 subunit alpha